MWQAPDAARDAKSRDAEHFLALKHLAAAWVDAEDAGIGAEDVAHAAIYAALATLVNLHGEEEVARLFQSLPGRIASGAFNLDYSLQ